jgi:hypothetical protein
MEQTWRAEPDRWWGVVKSKSCHPELWAVAAER